MRAKQQGAKTPTFAQNLHQLHKLKQELLTLNHIFSPDSVNYHQLMAISSMKKELQASQQEIGCLKNNARSEQKTKQNMMDKLERERKELEEVNIELVGYNDKLVQQLEATSAKLESLAKELEQEKHLRKEAQIKHAREIENLKLMHSQELYILKKKEKKVGP